MALTITEALAEIKTIGKRLEKKREFVKSNLARQEGVKDPLTKDGGTIEVLTRERQAIGDLETRIVVLRRAIQEANDRTDIAIGTTSRTLSDWLTWRREVAPGQREFLNLIRQGLLSIRDQARRTGAQVTAGNPDAKPTDLVINLDEGQLARDIEEIEMTLGALDGQLSLKNATVIVNVD